MRKICVMMTDLGRVGRGDGRPKACGKAANGGKRRGDLMEGGGSSTTTGNTLRVNPCKIKKARRDDLLDVSGTE